jgi:hypothetical protein
MQLGGENLNGFQNDDRPSQPPVVRGRRTGSLPLPRAIICKVRTTLWTITKLWANVKPLEVLSILIDIELGGHHQSQGTSVAGNDLFL